MPRRNCKPKSTACGALSKPPHRGKSSNIRDTAAKSVCNFAWARRKRENASLSPTSS
ncbi:hypothetical protein D9X30_1692 (plasmid) [Cupriavidus sp. U2]|nr:hypothetical protein D9X30_1692 [Cupriavidus sp. U2]